MSTTKANATELSKDLYDAAVGYLVSAKSEADSWAKVVAFASSIDDADELATHFKVVESQVKKDFGIGKMPGAWRSAKNHALAALKSDIPLLRETGGPRGKTEVWNDIKATRSTRPRDPLAEFEACIRRASALYTALSGTEHLAAVSIVNAASWMPGSALTSAAKATP